MKYKPVYQINLIDQDTMTKWIDEVMAEFPPLSYHDELQNKLVLARESIRVNEYLDSYFVPKLEDLKDGDIVEISTSYGWSSGKWPEVLTHDTHVNLWGGDTIESRFNYATLRMKKPIK